MQALADARASTIQQRKKGSQTHSKDKHTGQERVKTKQFTFGSFRNL
jgi:hypothetical protein